MTSARREKFKEDNYGKEKAEKRARLYMLALVAICAILAVVGVFLNWIGRETILDDVFGDSEQKGFTLGDFDTLAEEFGLEIEPIQGIRAVGYLAVAAICVVLVAYVVKQLFSFGLFRIIVILGGVATMAIGVAAIAYTASQTADWDIVVAKLVPGVGCYLTSIGAIAGGLFAAVGCFKK